MLFNKLDSVKGASLNEFLASNVFLCKSQAMGLSEEQEQIPVRFRTFESHVSF